MGIPILVLGESGTGKSTSLRNLDPNSTLLLQTIQKPLPFRAKGWKAFVEDNSNKLVKYVNAAAGKGKNIVILDDFQYLLANEFMNRSSEVGFTKFTEIARHAWDVIMAAQNAPGDTRFYFLMHTTTDESGITKAKTIGKLLDEKITLEGLFTIVFRTIVTDKGYYFSTHNNGADTVKTPLDLFDDDRIDNDLSIVDKAICEYYKIQPTEKRKAT